MYVAEDRASFACPKHMDCGLHPELCAKIFFSESFALRRLPVPGELSVWNENTVLEDIRAHVNSMQFRD